jgi:nitrite reductase/ring-hydroxylating ferredoxin subunit
MTILQPIPMAYRDDTSVFPKGWYGVADSETITANTLTPVNYLNLQLIVYRDKEGKAHVADAFCPHLGAHLASFDGQLKDGEIVCPFHKWRFDAESGRCTSIPYAKVVPPKARLTLYPTMEVGGMVMMWWHPAGGAPDYTPFDVRSRHADSTWLLRAEKVKEGTVPFRDLFENLFDTAHIQQLHGGVGLPEIEAVTRTEFGLQADYAQPGEGERWPIKSMQCNFSGLSFMSQSIIGEGFGFIQNAVATPIDHERMQLRVRMYIQDTGSPQMNDFIGGEFVKRVLSEIDQDFEVLNYKKHLKAPLLCSGDGPINRYREYAREMFA